MEEEPAASRPRRTLTIDLDTGEWVGGCAISEHDGYRVAASVLPGVSPEQVGHWYGEQMADDPRA